MNTKRFQKVAVFGDNNITRSHLRLLAESVVRSLDAHTVVDTISSDYFGKYVRQSCKKYGLPTYNRKLNEADKLSLQDTVATLAWRVRTFYCVFEDNGDSFASCAIFMQSKMADILNCKTITYNQDVFNNLTKS